MARAIGAPWTVVINGSVVLLGAAWFLTQMPTLRRAMRLIYRDLGILPNAPQAAQ
jgi:hypothetical protein